MKESNQEVFREEDPRTEYHCRWRRPYTFSEGVETNDWHYKPAHNRQERQQVNPKEHPNLAAVSADEQHDSLGYWLRHPGATFRGIHRQIRIVHGPQGVRILGLMFLDVSRIHPFQRLHEAIGISIIQLAKM